MELKDYWSTIRRRWRVILLAVLLTVGAASFVTWQATPMYASSAQLFVATTSSDTADAYQGGLFASQRVTSYADLVGTRELAETVADNLGGSVEASELRASVSAEVVPETVNLVITATNADPQRARDIAQGYAEALKDLVSNIETPAGKKDALITASIVDNADVETSPVSPQPTRNLGLGLLLGLLLGVGLAVARELMDTRVSSADDVAQVTDAPILGHINNDKAAVRKPPSRALKESTPWAEAFRVLRTNMQYVEVDHDRRVFVVSSSLPQEGKSTTALNLAVTLSTAGQRVVLVECDLRRPLIARRLGLDEAVGTTSVLIGRVPLSDALQTYPDTDLQVLSCGPRPPNPSELLQSHAMRLMLKELRDQFDVVILDAPPLLPVTDAALLSAQSDGMIAVVRHNSTTRDQLRHALERVEAVDAKCVGVVINLAPAKKSNKSYGYGYGYTYRYTTTRAHSRHTQSPDEQPRGRGRRNRRRERTGEVGTDDVT